MKKISIEILYTLIVSLSLFFILLVPKTFATSDLTDTGGVFEEYIETLLSNGVTSGYSDGTFRPDNFITRAEFSKLVVKVFNLKKSAEGISFNDLGNTNSELIEYINILGSIGIISGFPDGSFKPDDFITRGQAAKIIVESFKSSGYKVDFTEGNYFSDVKIGINSSLYSYIKAINNVKVDQKAIMGGFSDGTFRSDDFITRGQVAKVLALIISNQDKFERGNVVSEYAFYTTKNPKDNFTNAYLINIFDKKEPIKNVKVDFQGYTPVNSDLVGVSENYIQFNRNNNKLYYISQTLPTADEPWDESKNSTYKLFEQDFNEGSSALQIYNFPSVVTLFVLDSDNNHIYINVAPNDYYNPDQVSMFYVVNLQNNSVKEITNFRNKFRYDFQQFYFDSNSNKILFISSLDKCKEYGEINVAEWTVVNRKELACNTSFAIGGMGNFSKDGKYANYFTRENFVDEFGYSTEKNYIKDLDDNVVIAELLDHNSSPWDRKGHWYLDRYYYIRNNGTLQHYDTSLDTLVDTDILLGINGRILFPQSSNKYMITKKHTKSMTNPIMYIFDPRSDEFIFGVEYSNLVINSFQIIKDE